MSAEPSLRDRFSFRQRPTGVFKHLLRVPVYLYRWNLGWLFGNRLLLLRHRGRKSGIVRETPVEVVSFDPALPEWRVISGLGTGSDWYKNIKASPAVEIVVGTKHIEPVQRFLDVPETAALLRKYSDARPGTFRRLLSAMGRDWDGSDAGLDELAVAMPMIAFGPPSSTSG